MKDKLREALAATPSVEGLSNYLMNLSGLHPELARQMREAETAYFDMRMKLIEPKGTGTDLDRKVNLDARTAQLKQEFDELADLDRLVTQRINLVIIILTGRK